jgi:hypothetical protein
MKEECDRFAQESNTLEVDISDMRRRVNETEIEAQLHIQYMERKFKGDQDCESRGYSKKERELEDDIERIRKEIQTERKVNEAVAGHLKARTTTFRDQKKTLEERILMQSKEKMEKEIEELQGNSAKTAEEILELKANLDMDRQEKLMRDADEQAKKDEEKRKEDKKVAMEEAALGIQKKWLEYRYDIPASWKKKKKKGKGKGKKKK